MNNSYIKMTAKKQYENQPLVSAILLTEPVGQYLRMRSCGLFIKAK